MLDLLTTTPADVAALAPVWWRLRPDERGTVYAAGTSGPAAIREGLWPLALGFPPRADLGPLLVTADADLRPLAGRPAVVLDGAFTELPEGADHAAVGHLVLTATPLRAGALPVGVPRLDWWHHPTGGREAHDRPVVALAFRGFDPLDLDRRPVLTRFDGALQALTVAARLRGWEMLGHGHASLVERLGPRLAQLDVPEVTFDRILRRADVLVADDPRRLYEFARLTLNPTVALQAPWFPEQPAPALGVNIADPADLVAGVEHALGRDPQGVVVRRREAVRVYPHADGDAAERACDAIRRHVL